LSEGFVKFDKPNRRIHVQVPVAQS